MGNSGGCLFNLLGFCINFGAFWRYEAHHSLKMPLFDIFPNVVRSLWTKLASTGVDRHNFHPQKALKPIFTEISSNWRNLKQKRSEKFNQPRVPNDFRLGKTGFAQNLSQNIDLHQNKATNTRIDVLFINTQ